MGSDSSTFIRRKPYCRRDHSIAKKKVSGSIVISRDLNESSEFLKHLSPHFSVKGKSFITILPIVKSESLPHSDWVFFSSKNAVEQFFEQGYDLGNRKVAAIGTATATVLRKHCHINFIGEGNTTQVAEQFKEMLGSDLALFPVSVKSVQTVQQSLQNSQVINWEIYDTVEQVPESFELPDVLVFTSPSNVRSFMKSDMAGGKIANIVAIGNTTAKELNNHGVQNVYTPWKSSELALTDIIKPILIKKD